MLRIARNLFKRLFDRPDHDLGWFRVIVWWELRRLAYNAMMFPLGLIGGFLALLIGSLINPGADFDGLFISAFIYAFMANVCYTGGWIAELLLRLIWKDEANRIGPILLASGFVFSVALTIVGPVLLGLLGLLVRLAG